MPEKYCSQISLFYIYEDVNSFFTEKKSELVSLLEEHIDFSSLILIYNNSNSLIFLFSITCCSSHEFFPKKCFSYSLKYRMPNSSKALAQK